MQLIVKKSAIRKQLVNVRFAAQQNIRLNVKAFICTHISATKTLNVARYPKLFNCLTLKFALRRHLTGVVATIQCGIQQCGKLLNQTSCYLS